MKNETHELLIAARGMIEDKTNWCANEMAQNKEGRSVASDDEDAVRFCALGALHRAGSDMAVDVAHMSEIELQMSGCAMAIFGHEAQSIASINDARGHDAILAVFDFAIRHAAKGTLHQYKPPETVYQKPATTAVGSPWQTFTSYNKPAKTIKLKQSHQSSWYDLNAKLHGDELRKEYPAEIVPKPLLSELKEIAFLEILMAFSYSPLGKFRGPDKKNEKSIMHVDPAKPGWDKTGFKISPVSTDGFLMSPGHKKSVAKKVLIDTTSA